MIFGEHWGMMKKQGFKEGAYAKVPFYENCGLHLWDNFTIAFPDKNGALDTVATKRVC